MKKYLLLPAVIALVGAGTAMYMEQNNNTPVRTETYHRPQAMFYSGSGEEDTLAIYFVEDKMVRLYREDGSVMAERPAENEEEFWIMREAKKELFTNPEYTMENVEEWVLDFAQVTYSTPLVLEQRLREQFVILNKNADESDKIIENGTMRLFTPVEGIVPQDEREAMFLNAAGEGFPMLVPATLENVQQSLRDTIEYYGLDIEIKEDSALLKNWSAGSTKEITEPTFMYETEQTASLSQINGRIQLPVGTQVKLVDWALIYVTENRQNPHAEEKMWEYVEILDGTHKGQFGWVTHEGLN